MKKFSAPGQKGFIHGILLILMVAGLVAGVYLLQNTQIFKSRASNDPIVFKSSTGQALPVNGQGIPQTTSATVKIEFTSTLGTPVFATPTPRPTVAPTSTPIPTSSATPTPRPTASLTPRPTATPTPISTPMPTPTPSPAPASRVFVTSTTYNGDLKTTGSNVGLGAATSGLDGADKLCQSRANAAGLGGTWKAWLSDSTNSAASRLIHSTSPYKLINGTTIADNWADLTDGSLKAPINMNELNRRSLGTANAWTNTSSNGNEKSNTKHCNNWTIAQSDSAMVTVGWQEGTNSSWTDTLDTFCFVELRLYCFEQVAGFTAPAVVEGSPKNIFERVLERMGLVLGVSFESATPVQVAGTVSYRFAETPTDLEQTSFISYTQDPMVVDYTFRDLNPGMKFIWVEFKDISGVTERRSSQIEIVSATPSPTLSSTIIPTSALTATPAATSVPVLSPTPTPQPSTEPKIISYEAFTFKKANGEQKIVQSLFGSDGSRYGRYCSVTGSALNCSNNAWYEPADRLPQGTKPIISYGAFTYYAGSQQKVVQSVYTNDGSTFTRTCNVGADDVNWAECNAAGWIRGTISAPDGSGAKIIGYGVFSLIWLDASGGVTKQKVVQTLVADNGQSYGRYCNVAGNEVNWAECNAAGWTKNAINAPDGSGLKIISYGAFTYYAGSQQKVTQSLYTDNGTTFTRTCNVGADDVNWAECNSFGWTQGKINPPVKSGIGQQ